jgi:hypothetical protein
MTKTQLLSQIESNVDKMGVLKNLGTQGDMVWYQQQTWSKDNNVVNEKKIGFYVENEGTPEEAAYFSDRNPFAATQPQVSFIDKVHTYLTNKAGIKYYRVDSEKVDVKAKTAEVVIYTENAQNSAKVDKRTYVLAEVDGKAEHAEITNA